MHLPCNCKPNFLFTFHRFDLASCFPNPPFVKLAFSLQATLQKISGNEVPWKNRDGSTLIAACVGVGNVGQLCMDVLISTLDAKFIAYLDSSCVQSVTGPNPYPELSASPAIACSMEVSFLSFLPLKYHFGDL